MEDYIVSIAPSDTNSDTLPITFPEIDSQPSNVTKD